MAPSTRSTPRVLRASDVTREPFLSKQRAAGAGAGHTTQSEALLAWYDRHRRALPWRALPGQAPDPYAVWLSEVMLQQTTVQAVKPYYAAFLQRWPTVHLLAGAPTEAVMQAWAGLGYYSRARNLHACAKLIVDRHGGAFPADEAALRKLPGIGAYTAAAISAIAYGQRAVVVDGNVERVTARLHAVEEPLPGARPALGHLAADATPWVRPGDYAQAMMDLGATICTPRNPACVLCPLRPSCRAAALGTASSLPQKVPKRANPVRHGIAYYIVDQGGRVLVRSRPPSGLLGGMTELPGTEWLAATADPGPPELATGQNCLGRVTHAFTHFTLLLDVVSCPAPSAIEMFGECRWVPVEDLGLQAWSTLMENALALAVETFTPRKTTRQMVRSGFPKRQSS